MYHRYGKAELKTVIFTFLWLSRVNVISLHFYCVSLTIISCLTITWSTWTNHFAFLSNKRTKLFYSFKHLKIYISCIHNSLKAFLNSTLYREIKSITAQTIHFYWSTSEVTSSNCFTSQVTSSNCFNSTFTSSNCFTSKVTSSNCLTSRVTSPNWFTSQVTSSNYFTITFT